MMESRAKLAGHAMHPMLVVFPLGLLISAVVFDLVYLVTGNAVFATIAFYNIVAGLITGLLAAVFGIADAVAIPNGTRAQTIAIAHGVGNALALVLFLGSVVVRHQEPGYVPSVAALLPEWLALGVLFVTGWLGAELVERLGVGVDPGAHVNAPSSLTSAPPAQREAKSGSR